MQLGDHRALKTGLAKLTRLPSAGPIRYHLKITITALCFKARSIGVGLCAQQPSKELKCFWGRD